MIEIGQDAELFTSAQVCDATGATYRQLDAWARGGIIHPASVDVSATGICLTAAQERQIRVDYAAGESRSRIARRFGVHLDTVGRVLSRPHVSTPPAATPGSGRKRLWNAGEVAVIERMVRLCLAGLVPARAAEVARLPGVEVEVAAGVYVRVDGDTGDTGGGS